MAYLGLMPRTFTAANKLWTYIEAETDDTVRWLKVRPASLCARLSLKLNKHEQDEYALHTGRSIDDEDAAFVDGDGSLADWLSDNRALGELVVPYVSEVLVPLRIIPLKDRPELPALTPNSPPPEGQSSPVPPTPTSPALQPTNLTSPISPVYMSPRSPLLKSPAYQPKSPLPHASEWEGWAHDPEKRSGIAHIIAMGNRPLKPAPSLAESYKALLGAGSKALLGSGSWA